MEMEFTYHGRDRKIIRAILIPAAVVAQAVLKTPYELTLAVLPKKYAALRLRDVFALVLAVIAALDLLDLEKRGRSNFALCVLVFRHLKII